MSQVFHDIEKKIISSLRDNPTQTSRGLEQSTGLSPDQVRRGIEWLRLKDLAAVSESETVRVGLGKNGLESVRKGLPERRLLDSLRGGPKKLRALQEELGPAFGAAMGLARKNGWVAAATATTTTTTTTATSASPSGSTVCLKNPPPELPGEKSLAIIGRKKVPVERLPADDLEHLLRRPDFVVREVTKTREVSLTEKAGSIRFSESAPGAIDVEAGVPRAYIARTHPLKDTIEEIREVFVTLGFSEILGNMSQSCFWNFDALFTPQDHPARELQDTFYLDGVSAKKIATPEQIRGVSGSHKNGWQYSWDVNEAKRMVLRTHTTCVTIRHLAETRPDEARIFSLGRVFRNEKVSYKHLVEFNQVEGVVVGRNATLRDLMGIQKEFYRRIGITRIKFWPTFFPYTEPSLQTMVYNERLGKWVELFGMGIFRPEVTRPLGISKPVLAWGGGIERIAMLKCALDDVREFYNNDMDWLRSAGRCR